MKSVRRKVFVAEIAVVALGVSLVAARRFRREAIEAEARHHNNLGVALLDESLPEGGHQLILEAVSEFEAALRLVPAYRPARINLGIAPGTAREAATPLSSLSTSRGSPKWTSCASSFRPARAGASTPYRRTKS